MMLKIGFWLSHFPFQIPIPTSAAVAFLEPAANCAVSAHFSLAAETLLCCKNPILSEKQHRA